MNLRYQILLLAVVLIAILVITSVFTVWRPGGSGAGSSPMSYPPASYIGRDSCIDCHEQEHNLWLGSHHDLAMQEVSEDTVLGDFNDTSFTHFGITSRFYKKDGKFFVNTDGPDGEMHDYEIAYVFGVTPLQQYMIEFPGGRYQVLGICWDARPEEDGGQRWYHLYDDEAIPYNDELHWTGPNQNWNYMCAECHSTDLKKNYDLATDTFKTSWEEINVSCESCHGPSSNHVAWAKEYERGIDRGDPTKGMSFQILDDGGTWQFAEGEVTAQRTKPRDDQTMLEMCARCHSRRTSITNDYEHGGHLLNTHLLTLLEEDLYFADGQIQDEVYVYGSFLQSKMHQKGVTCTDCHDPHSMQIIIPGNNLCSQCHLPSHYDTPKHHFHEQGTEGASCVACHMPTRTYMGVDDRRDHSLRVPRPDLSIKTGSPNACNECHDDQTYQWAKDAMDEWYGPELSDQPHYADAIHAGRTRAADANEQLITLAKNEEQPGIVRATALAMLMDYPTPLSYRTLQAMAKDDDPTIRFAVVTALESVEPALRTPVAFDLLSDPVLTVRLEAGRILAPVDRDAMDEVKRQAVTQGIETYIKAQHANDDRAESHLNIALVLMQQGDADAAEQAYRTALEVNPRFTQAYVNLADLYRATERDDQAMALLHEAIDNEINHGVIHYALGLALVRQQDIPGAMKAFEQAVELTPEDPQFAYTYGIALNSTGQPERGLSVLAENHQRHPDDLNTLYALMTISRDHQRLDDALKYAQTLLAMNPPNADAVRAFIQQLRASQNPPQP